MGQILGAIAAGGALMISSQFAIWYRLGRVEMRQENGNAKLDAHVAMHNGHVAHMGQETTYHQGGHGRRHDVDGGSNE